MSPDIEVNPLLHAPFALPEYTNVRLIPYLVICAINGIVRIEIIQELADKIVVVIPFAVVTRPKTASIGIVCSPDIMRQPAYLGIVLTTGVIVGERRLESPAVLP